MREEPPQRGPTGASEEAHEQGKVAYLDQALWHRLAEAETTAEFCHSWLGLQSRMIGGVSCGVVVLENPDNGSVAPAALWPRSTPEHKSLTKVVERALRERKGVVLRNDADQELESDSDLRFQLAYPVWADEKVQGVAAKAL